MWIIECHSMWRPLNFEIGAVATINLRIERFTTKLEQAASIRAELEAAPVGKNYDVSWASRIEHCVVSPFAEWIWTEEAELWLDHETPRVLSLSELFEVLARTAAHAISGNDQAV
jgi:hypothetical protein